MGDQSTGQNPLGQLAQTMFLMTPVGARWANASTAIERARLFREYERRNQEQLRRQADEEADIGEVEKFAPGVYTDPAAAMEQVGRFSPKTTRGLQSKTGLLKTAAERRGQRAVMNPDIYRMPTFEDRTVEVEPARPPQFFRPSPGTQTEPATGSPEMSQYYAQMRGRTERAADESAATGLPPTQFGDRSDLAMPTRQRSIGRADVIEEPGRPAVTRQERVKTGTRPAEFPEILQNLGAEAQYAQPYLKEQATFLKGHDQQRWEAEQAAIKAATAAAEKAGPPGSAEHRIAFVTTMQKFGFGAGLPMPEPTESRAAVTADLDARWSALPPEVQQDPTVSGLYNRARRQTAVGAKDASASVKDFYEGVRRLKIDTARATERQKSMQMREQGLTIARQKVAEMFRQNELKNADLVIDDLRQQADSARADLAELIRDDPQSPMIEVLRRQEQQARQLLQSLGERLRSQVGSSRLGGSATAPPPRAGGPAPAPSTGPPKILKIEPVD